MSAIFTKFARADFFKAHRKSNIMQLDYNPIERIQFASRFLVFLGIFILSAFLVFPMVSIGVVSFVYGIPYNEIPSVIANPEKFPNGISIYLLLQTISSIGGFLVTALIFLKSYNYNVLDYLRLKTTPALYPLLLSLLLILSNFAVVSLLGAFNYSIPVPELGGFSELVKATEEKIKVLTESLLNMNGPMDLLTRLFVMALVPAVVEEVFFRGLMQRFITEWTGKVWAGILISALVFALIHFRFTHIIPIFYVGVLFGYVFYRTGNLYYTILLHFIHNGSIVLITYLAKDSPNKEMLQDDYVPGISWVLPSILGLVVALYYLHKILPKPAPIVSVEEQTEEGGDNE